MKTLVSYFKFVFRVERLIGRQAHHFQSRVVLFVQNLFNDSSFYTENLQQ